MFKQLTSKLSLNSVFRETVIYGLSIGISKGLVFFSIPIFTALFTPEAYGNIEMLTTIGSIISLLMNMGLDAAMTFFFMEAKNNNKNTFNIVQSNLQLRIIIGLGMISILTIIAPWIIRITFDSEISYWTLWFVGLSMFLSTIISQTQDFFRLRFEPWSYMYVTVLDSLLTLSFMYFISQLFENKIKGYFFGMLIAKSITALFAIIFSKQNVFIIAYNKNLWIEFIKYGLPFVPAGLLIWIIQGSDRWFIIKMMGSFQLGLFSVGAKLSTILILFIEAFRQAWWPHAMDKIHQKNSGDYISKIGNLYLIIGSFISILLTIISPYIVSYLAPKEYYESWKIIGIYSWSSIFFGFLMISMLGVLKSKKTYLTLIGYVIGTIINLGLNYVLIENFGLIGAAFATSTAILVTNIIFMLMTSHFLDVKWSWITFITCIITSWSTIYWINLIM